MHGDLWKRIALTLAALFVVRLGTFIPLPGINPEMWTRVFRQHEGTLLGSANLLSGGGLRTLSILALTILPYVSVAVLVQLFMMVSQRLRAIADGGETGRRTIELYTRCGAVLLAAFQAYGIAVGLDGITGVVTYPSLVFRLSTVLTLTGGMLFLVWLAEQITARGIGNGIGLLLIASVLAEAPRNVVGSIEAAQVGILSQEKLVGMALLAVAFTVVAVAVERARRHVGLRFADRQVGDRHMGGQSVKLAFKLNPGGIVPPLVASWILLIVVIVAQIGARAAGQRGNGDWLAILVPSHPLHLALSGVIIILFAFVYAAFLHDPERLARHLATHGGAVTELAPGTSTADYLDDTLSRVTALGAVYLVAIMLLPLALAEWLELPFAVGGTWLLVLVCVTLDIETQVRAYLPAADVPQPDAPAADVSTG